MCAAGSRIRGYAGGPRRAVAVDDLLRVAELLDEDPRPVGAERRRGRRPSSTTFESADRRPRSACGASDVDASSYGLDAGTVCERCSSTLLDRGTPGTPGTPGCGEHRTVDPVVDAVEAHESPVRVGVRSDPSAIVAASPPSRAGRRTRGVVEQRVQAARRGPARAARCRRAGTTRRTLRVARSGSARVRPLTRWMRFTRLSNGTCRPHAAIDRGEPAGVRVRRGPRTRAVRARPRSWPRVSTARQATDPPRQGRPGKLTGRSSSVDARHGFRRHARRGGLPRRGARLARRAPDRRVRRARTGRRPGRRDGLGRADRVGADPRRRPLGRAVVAGRVRRPRRRPRAADHLQRGVRAGERAGAHLVLRRGAVRADAHPVRHRRAEAALPPEDPAGRGAVVPGLLRAERRQRPRQHPDPRRARRRRVGHQRPEGVDDARAPRRLVLRRVPHRSGVDVAHGLSYLLVPDGPAGHRGAAAAPDDRQRRVQRGVLRRRAHREGERARPGRRGLEGRDGDARLRARAPRSCRRSSASRASSRELLDAAHKNGARRRSRAPRRAGDSATSGCRS